MTALMPGDLFVIVCAFWVGIAAAMTYAWARCRHYEDEPFAPEVEAAITEALDVANEPAPIKSITEAPAFGRIADLLASNEAARADWRTAERWSAER